MGDIRNARTRHNADLCNLHVVRVYFQLRSRPILKFQSIENETHVKSDSDDTLGGRLIFAREAEGLSTAQLARRIGVKTDTLSAWEKDREEPRANKLVTMAGVLNVTPTWLLVGTGEGPTDSLAMTEMMKICSTIERLRETMTVVTDELENIEKRLECYNSYQD